MDSVLVVSSTDKGKEGIVKLLNDYGNFKYTFSKSGSEARRILIENMYDFVFVNSPLSDEFGHELAISVAENSTSGIIIIVKAELADNVSGKIEDYGIVVLSKPIMKYVFYDTVKILYTVRKRILNYKTQNIKLQKKIEEMRIIDRAKFSLMQYLNMTEEQSHHYIEKQAMDMRISKIIAAKEIIKMYEV